MDRTRVFAWLKVIETGSGTSVEVPLLAKRFLDEFVITLAYDAGESFELLQQRHLETLGLTEAQAFQLGLENLHAFVASGAVRLHAAGGVFAIIAGGNFEASLLLVDGMWNDVAQQLGGTRLFAALPARDLVAVAPATREGEATLRRWLEHCSTLDLSHRMSTSVYSWDGAAWRCVDELPRGSRTTT